MQIHNHLNVGPVAGHPQHPGSSREIPPRTDLATFGNTESLDHSFQQIPGSRPDKVAEAKQLISMAEYPPPETIQKIAQLLAIHLSQEPPYTFES